MIPPKKAQKRNPPTRPTKSYQHHWTWIVCVLIVIVGALLAILLVKYDLSYLKKLLGKDFTIYIAGVGTLPIFERIVNFIDKKIKN
jgi:hypothetical protein